jgi:hypothetical protein
MIIDDTGHTDLLWSRNLTSARRLLLVHTLRMVPILRMYLGRIRNSRASCLYKDDTRSVDRSHEYRG